MALEGAATASPEMVQSVIAAGLSEVADLVSFSDAVDLAYLVCGEVAADATPSWMPVSPERLAHCSEDVAAFPMTPATGGADSATHEALCQERVWGVLAEVQEAVRKTEPPMRSMVMANGWSILDLCEASCLARTTTGEGFGYQPVLGTLDRTSKEAMIASIEEAIRAKDIDGLSAVMTGMHLARMRRVFLRDPDRFWEGSEEMLAPGVLEEMLTGVVEGPGHLRLDAGRPPDPVRVPQVGKNLYDDGGNGGCRARSPDRHGAQGRAPVARTGRPAVAEGRPDPELRAVLSGQQDVRDGGLVLDDDVPPADHEVAVGLVDVVLCDLPAPLPFRSPVVGPLDRPRLDHPGVERDDGSHLQLEGGRDGECESAGRHDLVGAGVADDGELGAGLIVGQETEGSSVVAVPAPLDVHIEDVDGRERDARADVHEGGRGGSRNKMDSDRCMGVRTWMRESTMAPDG
ncbi:MAG: hypothetical protein JRI25_29455 [Deltaproteobacteria bacterium]|nr:hypothetical protein [Deltaproteobacteria bacterium]